jgi:hypothetical protein
VERLLGSNALPLERLRCASKMLLQQAISQGYGTTHAATLI